MDKKKTKDHILQVSLKLFLNYGYKDTSMSSLVLASGLSKGAFYHYFKNKEQLYYNVIDEFFISYINVFDWDKCKEYNIHEVENEIKQFYLYFIPEVIALTDKGMGRYFVLYFEAFDLYKIFNEVVTDFYSKLKELLVNKFCENNHSNPEIAAISLISKYEGLLFWFSINPNTQYFKLINEM
jgi:AcrR family transcriptional regulator